MPITDFMADFSSTQWRHSLSASVAPIDYMLNSYRWRHPDWVQEVFEGVPEGTYGIQGFQDVNGNGELDMGTFGPKEPWGMYRPKRPKFRGPKFTEIKFDVKEDMTDITFEMK